ncbi:MAG: LysR family transcriptional regulator [Proteobacteria bacterium]|nr:LysR family transcriptional regulator [Pseudomonadota bacterium]
MELHQVRYFLSLAQTLNFTRAADACNVTQPALTRAIQRLEDELGGPLLHRERNLTQLTDLGRTVLPLLEQTYAAALAAKEQAAAFKRRDAAPIRLGLGASISAGVIAPVLTEMQQRIKGLELMLQHAPTDMLVEQLLNSQLDVAVLVEPEKLPERLNRWPVLTERYVVICARGHRLANHETVPVSALQDESLLSRANASCDFGRILERLAAAAGFKPQIRHTASSEDHIQTMVAASMGIALSAERQPLAAGVIAKPLADEAAARNILLVTAAGRPQGPAVTAFVKLVRARDWGAPP